MREGPETSPRPSPALPVELLAGLLQVDEHLHQPVLEVDEKPEPAPPKPSISDELLAPSGGTHPFVNQPCRQFLKGTGPSDVMTSCTALDC